MSKENGGPAFPQPLVNTGSGSGIVSADECQVGGMTLRDYFAAKAMQGLLASGCLTQPLEGMVRPFNERETAEQCYAMADAMLDERSKP